MADIQYRFLHASTHPRSALHWVPGSVRVHQFPRWPQGGTHAR